MGLFDWLFGRKSKTCQGFGWCIDDPDYRDYEFAKEYWRGTTKGYADLREGMPQVVDQGSLGTCVPCVLTAMVSYLVEKELSEDRERVVKRGVIVPLNDDGPNWAGDYFIAPDGAMRWDMPKDPLPPHEFAIPSTSTSDPKTFSRLFLYYEGRRLEDKTDDDTGMRLRSGLRALRNKGVCLEPSWPYKTTRYAWKPKKAAYEEANKFRIKKYWRLKSMTDIKHSLDDGYPVAMGLMLYRDSWEEAGKSGVLAGPQDDRPLGGHCVLVVGYDDVKATLLCRNSMGAEWGDGGHFRMSEDVFYKRGLVSDLWTIRGDKKNDGPASHYAI